MDDGSGIIPCIDWLNVKDGNAKRIFELGALVDVQGRISEYRGQKQLTIESIGWSSLFPLSALFTLPSSLFSLV